MKLVRQESISMAELHSPSGWEPVIRRAVREIRSGLPFPMGSESHQVTLICDAIRSGEVMTMPNGELKKSFSAWVFIAPNPKARNPMDNIMGFCCFWVELWNLAIPVAVVGNAWIANGLSQDNRTRIKQMAFQRASDWAAERGCRFVLFRTSKFFNGSSAFSMKSIVAHIRLWNRFGFRPVEIVFGRGLTMERPLDSTVDANNLEQGG